MNIDLGEDFGQALMLAVVLFWICVGIVHIAFASGVFTDASQRDDLRFVGPLIWTLATLLGGVFVAGVYWIMHISAFNGAAQRAARPDDRDDDDR